MSVKPAVACLVVVLALAPAGRTEDPKPIPRVVLAVHGGAGDRPRDEGGPRTKLLEKGLENALAAGYQKLKKGGTSLDAVEAAIRVLEDDPHFNAGRGAVFTHEGRNELDASIMEGKTKKAGAVAGVTTIKNPISAARAVMEKSKHVLLAGRGAELFALKQGLTLVHPDYFRTEYRLKELQEALEKEKKDARRQGRRGAGSRHFGTVGAVAVDRAGNLAAGTSTGGLTNKMTGRIGDSPIIGAGTYADNAACAVSCTGHGEYFIRYAVAHDIAARMAYKGLAVRPAADEVVLGTLKKAGGEGGVIALDARGRLAVSFNSERMYRGYVTEDGKIQVFIGGVTPSK